MRRGMSWAFALAAVLGTASTNDAAAQVVKPFELSIATATPGGVYFSAGNAMCRLINRAQKLGAEGGEGTANTPSARMIDCQAATTLGSIRNLEDLRSRLHPVALIQSDWVYQASRGIGRFDNRRLDGLRSLFTLHQEAFQVVASRTSDIRGWKDLKGRRVNIGIANTPHRGVFEELLGIHGQKRDYFAQSPEINVTEHIDRLCDGDIDAMGVVTGVPSSPISAAQRRCGAYVVAMDTPEIKAWMAERSYLVPVTIPKSAYQNQREEVSSFGVVATAMTMVDLPDDVAYSIVKSVFENLEGMRQMHPALAQLDPVKMVNDGLAVPLHAGAERYFREKGLLKAPPAGQPAHAPPATAQAGDPPADATQQTAATDEPVKAPPKRRARRS